MGVWSRNAAGVYTLQGGSRTALIPVQTRPASFDFTVQLAPPTLAHNVFQLVPCSGDGRTGYEIGIVGVNIVIRSVLFADPSTISVKATAAHGLSSSQPFTQSVRFVNGKIEVRLNGSEDAALSYTIPDPAPVWVNYKRFGFVSNVDGAQVISAEICDLDPRKVDRADVLHVVVGGDYFVVEPDGAGGYVWRKIKSGAFKATGRVRLVQYHNYVIGVDGARAREIDVAQNTVVDYVPTAGSLPGATVGVAGSTTASRLAVYRDKLWMDFGPPDPQNLLGSATGNHRDLDTGSSDFGHAFGLGTGIAKVGQPVTCIKRSTRNSMIIGTNGSVWELTGDPTTGQADLKEILNGSGILDQDAACTLADGNMVMLTENGVYLLRLDGNPTPLSSPVLTEGINLTRDAAAGYIVQVRADPQRQMAYVYLTPESAAPATHIAYDERIGGYSVAGPGGLSGGWFPDDFAERFGPTASTEEPFNGQIVWGTRDGYLMVLDDEENTDDGSPVLVEAPLSLMRQMKLNRETIAQNLLVQPGDGCVVKYEIVGARTAEQLYGYQDGRYVLLSGTADEMRVVDPRKVRAPVLVVRLYNDEADSSFEVEETDIDVTLGRMVTRKNLVDIAAPDDPCHPPIFPASSSASSIITFSSGPGGGTQFSSGVGTTTGGSGTSEITGDTLSTAIASSIPVGFTSGPGIGGDSLGATLSESGTIITSSDTTGATGDILSSGASASAITLPTDCTIVGEGADQVTICESSGPQTLPGDSAGGAQSASASETTWTDLTPSADSKLVYVSSSVGQDGGDGSEAFPFASIADGYAALRDGFPDHLLIKCGDTFTESFPEWQKSGRSATQRMVVRSYGTGERPLIKTGTAGAISVRGLTGGADRRYLAFVGLDLWAHTNTGSSDKSGITLIAGGGAVDSILIEDCRIRQYRFNVSGEGIETRLSNIEIRRSVIADAIDASDAHRAAGILFGETDGLLLEECYLDHNGWSESIAGIPATQQSHNVYINPSTCTGVTTRGNISARAAASGLRSGGSLCELNVLLANPIGITLGPDTAVVRYNCVLDGRDIGSDPRGMGMDGAIGADVQIYDNVISHQATGTGNVRGISLGGVYTGLRLHSNVIYLWVQGANNQAPGLFLNGSPISDARVYSNDIQQAGGACIQYPSGITGHVFTGNRYYSDNATPFIGPSSSIAYAAWVTASGETGSSNSAVSYTAPSRTVATYMTSLGLTATLAAFMAACREQSRANWDSRFTAEALNNYIRAGFGLAAV